MNTYKSIYCDYAFLKNCYDTLDNNSFDRLCTILLCKSIKLTCNIPNDVLQSIDPKANAKDYPLKDLLAKLQSDGLDNIFINSYNFDIKNFIETNNYNVIIFSEISEEECAYYYNKYGIFAINSTKITNKFLKELLVTNGIYIHKKLRDYSWESIFPQNIDCCNSLIIIDNYILKYPNSFESNIFSILDSILPNNSLEIEFHIAIF